MNLVKGLVGSALLATAIQLPAHAAPVTAVLGVKGKVSMETLAKEVTDPSSPRYQQFYTAKEIRKIAGPSRRDYNQLLSQLRQKGFQVVGETSTHLWVTVQAESELFEQTFATKFAVNSLGKRKPAFRALIPSEMPLVERVLGLDNTRHSVPKYKMTSEFLASLNSPDRGGHGGGKGKGHHGGGNGGGTVVPDNAGGIPQSAIKDFYGLTPLYNSGITGAGEHIAIATYSGFNIDDVKNFYNYSGLSPVPQVDQVTFNGTPAFDQNSALETELDAEFSGMIAPGASIHVFASATNDEAGEAAMFTAILDDGRANVVNYSWGDCETNLDSDHANAMQTIFQQAVAQGVNIMNASGDSGSASCADGSTTTVADFPAANAYVVAVGGTSLAQNGGSYTESAWSCTLDTLTQSGCSGGGVSTMWAMPSWQNGLLPSNFTMRAYPDVSLNADPQTGQDIYITYNGQAQWGTIGGTSMAAPQWSGFMALVGQARKQQSKGALGFANPFFYGASASQKGQIFNDITSGSNGAYNTNSGWDAVTGWGSLQGQNLLSYLIAQ